MDSVTTPIAIEHSGELRNHGIDQFFERKRVGGRKLVASPARPRRPWDVLEHGHVLNRADRRAEEDCAECVTKAPKRSCSTQRSRAGRRRKSKVEGERAARQEQIL